MFHRLRHTKYNHWHYWPLSGFEQTEISYWKPPIFQLVSIFSLGFCSFIAIFTKYTEYLPKPTTFSVCLFYLFNKNDEHLLPLLDFSVFPFNTLKGWHVTCKFALTDVWRIYKDMHILNILKLRLCDARDPKPFLNSISILVLLPLI